MELLICCWKGSCLHSQVESPEQRSDQIFAQRPYTREPWHHVSVSTCHLRKIASEIPLMRAVVGYQPASRKQDSRFSYYIATLLIELGFQRTQGYISTRPITARALFDQFGLCNHSGAGDGIIFTKTCTCLHTSLLGELSDVDVTSLKAPECPQSRSVAKNPPSGRK